MDGQAFGCGRFARRRRSCHQHHARASLSETFGDLVGYGSDFLVVDGLCHGNQHAHVALVGDGLVEHAHAAHSYRLVELYIVGKRLEQFWLRINPRRLSAVAVKVGRQQEQSALVGHKVEHPDIGCRRHKVAIVTVYKPFKAVICGIEVGGSFKQRHLVSHPGVAKQLDDICRKLSASDKRNVGGNDFLHATLHGCDSSGVGRSIVA